MASGVRWVGDRRRGERRTSGMDGTRVAGLVAVLLGALLLVAWGPLRLMTSRPIGAHSVMPGGVQNATATELTSFAAYELEAALTSGDGITFEVVQTSTIAARLDGPKVEVPDPKDRTTSLGEADTYAVGTLIERGIASPDGFWSELLHGPKPGAEASFDLAKSESSRAALVRDGAFYRDDGAGWHRTDVLPGIGLDPDTVGLLPAMLAGLTDLREATIEPPERPSATTPTDAFTLATTPLDPVAVAASIRGLDGTATEPVRGLSATTTNASLPGIIAVDLVESTELAGPAELLFDESGRLVSLLVRARNTRLDTYDLVVETYITLRYPDHAPGLPKPEPVYEPVATMGADR